MPICGERCHLMRNLLHVIAILPLVLSASANALNLEKLKAVNIKWVKNIGDNDGKPEAPFEAKVRGPGDIIVTRLPGTDDQASFAMAITDVLVTNTRRPLNLKSSTCSKVPANLSCEIKISKPHVAFTFAPLSTGEWKNELPLNLEVVSPAFISKHLPELTGLDDLNIDCNDWSWAADPKTSIVEVLEIATLSNNLNNELGRVIDSQQFLAGNFNCSTESGRCSLNQAFRDLPIAKFEYPLLQDQPLVIELNEPDGSQACTIEFQAGDPITSSPASISAIQQAALTRANNSIATLQRRLDENFIGKYSKAVINSHVSHGTGFGGEVYASNIVPVLKFPALYLMNQIQPFANQNSSCTSDGKCESFFLMMEQSVEEAE